MRALFINPGGIGDQILFLPAIKLFKNIFPSCLVDLITEPRSACINELTGLFNKVKEFDFKASNPKYIDLLRLIRGKNYKYTISSGASYKANFVAALSNAEIKIGFYKGIFSNLLLTHAIKLDQHQYASNMLADLIKPFYKDTDKRVFETDLIPEVDLSPELINWGKETLAPRMGERYQAKKIFIHPGVSKLSIKKNILKFWTSQNWAKLIERLASDPNNTVILFGGKDDQETINEINKHFSFFAKPRNFFDFSSMNLTISQLAALINLSDVMVCVDSAPMHIAIGLRKKTVSFFGPTNPKKLLPQNPRFKAVHLKDLSCQPCLFDKRTESCEKPVCLDVPIQMMYDAIISQLD